MSDEQRYELPNSVPVDRLMSSVMSLAQNAIDRVEQYRAVVARMIEHDTDRDDDWWKAWELLKATYSEEAFDEGYGRNV